jgi:hypothetical protein
VRARLHRGAWRGAACSGVRARACAPAWRGYSARVRLQRRADARIAAHARAVARWRLQPWNCRRRLLLLLLRAALPCALRAHASPLLPDCLAATQTERRAAGPAGDEDMDEGGGAGLGAMAARAATRANAFDDEAGARAARVAAGGAEAGTHHAHIHTA